jgi:hypothetical protein
LVAVHTVRGLALIVAHDLAGATHTTQLGVVVRGASTPSAKHARR